MPARTIPPSASTTWPAGWPSFIPKDNDPSDTFQLELKRSLVAEYGADNLEQAWIKTCNKLKEITSRIARQGSSAVPVLTYDQDTGCFIVRDVIPHNEATDCFEDLQQFMADNGENITGWPAKNPAIFHLYSSPVQLKLRTHPRQLNLQYLINSLFSDGTLKTPEEQSAQLLPVLYPDALRIRQPGQDFLGLGPHIDGGSLVRWCDGPYSLTYSRILSGKPEEYDPYDLTHRRAANSSLFPGGAQCSVLRGFQGWTALTSCAPGEGGLMLLPDIQAVTAYMILRPFFKPPPEECDLLDPESWTIDTETGWFPGTYRWDSQLLSPASHPHLCLEQTLVSAPRVEPGDTICRDLTQGEGAGLCCIYPCGAVNTKKQGVYPKLLAGPIGRESSGGLQVPGWCRPGAGAEYAK
ncbi:duf1479 domain-containing protein [Exophiala viscosa]|uniref:Duf1479 domain-containing protein n=1 Tax=Exophiala viscosa TaxID=2486360 RepID=A0AAN6E403_9EURO|nr:duf1479 domain-containing protein [Exophiala viscosa]KAI1626537.1 duf1479 domain-containing protein [Exophiala viscosa]